MAVVEMRVREKKGKRYEAGCPGHKQSLVPNRPSGACFSVDGR